MTAYIDNIIIQGTPEEIQEFIELRNQKEFGEGLIQAGGSTICLTCYSIPCKCKTGIDIGTPDGYFSIHESGKTNFCTP